MIFILKCEFFHLLRFEKLFEPYILFFMEEFDKVRFLDHSFNFLYLDNSLEGHGFLLSILLRCHNFVPFSYYLIFIGLLSLIQGDILYELILVPFGELFKLYLKQSIHISSLLFIFIGSYLGRIILSLHLMHNRIRFIASLVINFV